MLDLIRAKVRHNGFQDWLNRGNGSFMLSAGEKNIALLLRFDKVPGASYLYAFSPLWNNTVSWDDSPKFAGVYVSDQRLFLTKDALSDFMEPWAEPLTENQSYISSEIGSKVNQYIDGIIQNDSSNLSTAAGPGWTRDSDYQYYLEHGARRDAIELLFKEQKPDTQFHSDYSMGNWLDEDLVLAYLKDSEAVVKTHAEQYLASHQEQFLLQFLEMDALQKAYQELMSDAANPAHKMKAITDAVKTSGAKTVNVTVLKNGHEMTFKTAAHSLRGYRENYNCFDIQSADRQKFEQAFGRYADYTADEITRITYGRNTIYEVTPAQEENICNGLDMTM